jgi:hypothetical protein
MNIHRFFPTPQSSLLVATPWPDFGIHLKFKTRKAVCYATVLAHPMAGQEAGLDQRFAAIRGHSRFDLPSKHTGPKLLWLGCCVGWLCGSVAQANRVYWYALAGPANLTQAGVPMGAGFNFELGVFKSGFVPTVANRAQWTANWVAAQRMAYQPVSGDFAGLYVVADNAAPFTVGKAAYVWGFQGGVGTSEWILYRNPAWTWPAPNPMNPNPIFWNTSAATALIGSVNTTDTEGHPVLMRSATVTDAVCPATPWPQWQTAELAGEPLNGPSDDPDRDGTVNLLEYVFGTPPRQAGAPPQTPVAIVTVSGQRFVQIAIPRRPDHPATLTVQVSSDLTTWASGPAATVAVEDSPAGLVVRDLTPLGAGVPRRFMRVSAGLVPP